MLIAGDLSACVFLVLMAFAYFANWGALAVYFCYAIVKFGSNLALPANDTTIIDVTPPEDRRYVYTVNYWVVNLALGGGALVGGFLYNAHFGAVIVAGAIGMGGALVVTVLFVSETRPAQPSDAPPAKIERGAPSLRIGDPGPMGRILIRGEAGHDIIPSLYPLDGEIVIDKPGKGAFYATELGDLLQKYGIENLLVCGVTTEVCVNTTVREANDRGYDCLVVSDCTGSYFPEFHAAGLAMIKAQGGIFGWVAPSYALLAALA